jgi:death on curing protein
MKYLSAESILVIHAMIIDETGGIHGVRDIGLLQSIAEKPKTIIGGKPAYKAMFEKTAVYFEALVNYRVFIDGNKRTAIGVSARFLHINGYTLTAPNEEMEKFTLKTVAQKLEIKEIAKWFKKHAKDY